MNIQDEFNRVCRLAGLIEIKNAPIPTWKTHDGLEALELKKDKLLTFWFKEGQRIYNQPIGSNKITLALQAFEEKPKDTNEVNNEYKKIEKQSTETRTDTSKTIIPETDVKREFDKVETGVINIDSVGLMPENLTKLLFEKWQKMPVEERLIMLQTTDTRYIEEKKGRGGKYKYVTGHYMIMCANMAFGFLWSSQVQQWEWTDSEIICMGYIETKINGELIKKYAIGQQDITFTQGTKTPVCLGDNYKAAEMDMIKKALSFFGIAKDVYSGEV